jgi:4-hydroxymandelate oxidase
MSPKFSARREFLRFLAASPLMAQAWAQDVPASPKDVLSVMDFEPLARKALPPAHWGYMTTGVDDDVTLRMNREAFGHYQLRARRLVDVTEADLKIKVFDATWDTPIYVSAVGSQKAFHSEGELATARAAKAKKTMQMLSTVTSVPVEDVAKSLGTPPWFQLYMPVSWNDTEKLVKRALHKDRQAGLFDVPREFPHRRVQHAAKSGQAYVRWAFRRDESAASHVDLRGSAEEADEDETGAQGD